MQERLYRSRQKRIIGGVASGLGDYLNIDPVILRVLFVIITLINGLGLLLYIILWIVIPEGEQGDKNYSKVETNSSESIKEDPSSEKTNPSENQSLNTDRKEPYKKSRGSGRVVAGIILIGLGLVFLAREYLPVFRFSDLFPLVLIIFGGILIWNSTRRK
jgi:phage shock protein PspC (stress-responsive transcriptional regulator)